MERKREFLNRDVAQILGISQRRIIGLTEKSIVVPLKEAAGAGYKRQYDYASLLELSIYKSLSQFGLNINAIKKMLWGLRTNEVFKDWATGFAPWTVSEKLTDEYKLLWKKNRKSPSFKLPTFLEWYKSLGPEETKKILSKQWEHTKAIMACFVDESGVWNFQLYLARPQRITVEEIQTHLKSGSFICLDLMKIKNEIDQKIIDREKNHAKGSEKE